VYERGWSIGPVAGRLAGPWTLFGRTNDKATWRPNPPIDEGTITSALVGGALEWESDQLTMTARVRAEVGSFSPKAGFVLPSTPISDGLAPEDQLTQVTTDIAVSFPTFGEHEYALDVHWVTTPSGAVPAQRYAYLGGPGTLPLLDMLELGGDELLLVDQRYSIPFPNIQIGFMGVPTLELRHRLGSAGIGKLPSFEQMIGVGVSLTIIRAEVQFDPIDGRIRFGGGFTFSR
jgi:hypothetical protein